jgi:2-haloacid dehalogenase
MSTTSFSPKPKVLAFDVFGTVVDFYGSIRREIEVLFPQVDSSAFALAWREGYQPAMQRVRSGELGWTRIDDLHRMILDSILPQFGLQGLSEAERKHLNLVWHRLHSWPDSVEGMQKLGRKFSLCTLSNGNLSLLCDLAKHNGLPWDLILSAENFHHYKPDPETYLGVADVFDVAPEEVMLVAAHEDDLIAAAACGLQTAYVHRPFEFGLDANAKPRKKVSAELPFNWVANDLNHLASQLGC